jgi:hypothetical protein
MPMWTAMYADGTSQAIMRPYGWNSNPEHTGE